MLKKLAADLIVLIAVCGYGLAGKSIVLNPHKVVTCQTITSKDDEIFAAVPARLRSRLIERLNQLIQYRKAHDWNQFVRLLGTATMNGRSFETVAKSYSNDPGAFGTDYEFVRFLPKSTTVVQNDGEKWIISGCTELSRINFRVESFVIASRQNEDWFFSDFDTAIRDAGFMKCIQTTKSSRSLRAKKQTHRK